MNKTVFYLALALVATPGLAADTTSPAIERLVDCAAVNGTRERLRCFDQEIAPFVQARSAPSSPPMAGAPAAGARPAPMVTAPTPAPAATFGDEQLAPKLRPAAPEDEQVLHAHITQLRQVGSGNFIVTLDNGQSWSHSNQTLGEYLRKGEAITISKAALGSYRLTRDAGASKNWIRVQRIR